MSIQAEQEFPGWTPSGFVFGKAVTMLSTLSVTGAVTLPSATTVGGNSLSALSLGTVTSSGANALAVGANGVTNPVFNIDASVGSVATGLNIQGKAAGGGLVITELSSGTNESMTLDAKGSGTITLNGTATGAVIVGNNLAVTGTLIGTSASATAFVVGRQGSTSPAFTVDASTGSSVTGLKVKAAATSGGVALSATDSGSNTGLTLDAKGTGIINIGSVSTGAVEINSIIVPVYEYVTSGPWLGGAAAGAGILVNGTGQAIYTAPNDSTSWKFIACSVRCVTLAGAAATLQVEVAGAGVAPGSGTNQLSAALAIGTAGTANTTANGTIIGSPTTISAGSSINIIPGGAATTTMVGCVVTIALQRLS